MQVRVSKPIQGFHSLMKEERVGMETTQGNCGSTVGRTVRVWR